MPERVKMALEGIQGFSFVLHGQPILPVQADASTTPDWYELLLRMRAPGRMGLLMPIDFMPGEDRPDLLLKIDCWVIQQAKQILINHPLRISINFTKHLLHLDNLQEEFLHLLGLGLSQRLTLEVSEKYVFSAFEIEMLQSLSVLVDLQIDDIGEARLTELITLPISGFKIDGRIIEQVHRNLRAAALVRTLISFAQASDLTCVCEFVSTPAIWQWLSNTAADYPAARVFVQGHAVGKYRHHW